MSIPDFQSMMLPLLEVTSDGKRYSNREVGNALAVRFGVTDDELAQVLPSGVQTTFDNRLCWAESHLKKAGLVESPSRGSLLITEQGRAVVNQRPSKVNIRFLKQFPAYDWHKKDRPEDDIADADDQAESTPEELLESSYRALRSKLADELLDKVKNGSPLFFEQMVVKLLVAMGYGGSREDAGKAIGRSGDGGIDGIINEDRLGLDIVCIQAKRWRDNSVGREVVQAFAGSMEGHRAEKRESSSQRRRSRKVHWIMFATLSGE